MPKNFNCLTVNFVKTCFSGLTVFLFIIFFSTEVIAEPLGAKLYTNTLDAKVGDTIYLKLKVNPKTGEPIYTVSASLMYQPSILEYISVEFADSMKMLPVPKPPYTLTDTVNGMIRRTAGYTNGTDSLSDFTKYEFKAVKEGDAIISVEDGVALDGNNTDIGLQQKQLTIHVGPAAEATTTDYNIELSLDILGPLAIYKEEDYKFNIFQPEKKAGENAMMKIYVYNEKAELFYSKEVAVNTGDGQYIPFTIPADTFEVGNYVISAETTFADGNKEVVAQKYIGVLSNGKNWFTKHKDILIPLSILFVCFAVLHHIAKDRDLYFKIASRIRRKKKTTIRRKTKKI